MSSRLDRRGTDRVDDEFDLARAHPCNVAHDQATFALMRRIGKDHRIAQEQIAVFGEVHFDIEDHAIAGRAIMVAPPHGLEDRVAIEAGCEEAGQSAGCAEERCARKVGARPSLVPVRIAHDADAIILLEGVAQDPFERAPGGVDLDGGLEPSVMGEGHIGIAAADMRHDDAILAFELAKEFVRVMTVGILVRHVLAIPDLRMARAVDGFAFVAVMDIAIAADGRVGAPLIARNAHEFSGDIEFPGQRIEFAPECAGDLEVIALMADDVEKGPVAAEFEIFARGVRPQCLVRLAVGIAPEMHVFGVSLHDTHRI